MKVVQLPLKGQRRFLEMTIPEKVSLQEIPDILLSVMVFLRSCSVVTEKELEDINSASTCTQIKK